MVPDVAHDIVVYCGRAESCFHFAEYDDCYCLVMHWHPLYRRTADVDYLQKGGQKGLFGKENAGLEFSSNF